jgi:hypothetical protein
MSTITVLPSFERAGSPEALHARCSIGYLELRCFIEFDGREPVDPGALLGLMSNDDYP